MRPGLGTWLGGMLVVALLVIAGIPGAGSADAFWRATGTGVGSAITGTLLPPTAVTVGATSGPAVAASWTASAGTTVPTGYFVTRTTGSTTVAACASSATTLLTATSCTDTAVPAGTYTYAVTAVFRTWTAVSASSSTVVVTAATKLAITVQPTTTVAGVALSPSVAVTLQNAAGTTVATAGIPVTMAIGTNAGPGGLLSGTLTVNTNASGIAVFPTLSIDRAGVGYTLAATSPGLTAATSSLFTVTAAAATKLVFTSAAVSSIASATANSTAITVQRQDALGNPAAVTSLTTLTLASNSTGTTVITPTSGATTTAVVTFAVGASTATFFYGDTKVGTPSITATLSGLTAAVQSETITAAAASKLVITSTASTAIASASTNSTAITVQRQDAFGNPVAVTAATPLTLTSNSTGTAIFAPTNGAAGSAVAFAVGSSVATFYYGDTKAGSPIITAAVTGLTSATQTETITAAAATKLVFTSVTRSAAASATTNGTAITVQRQDQFNNPVTVATGTTLTLTSNSTGTAIFAPGTGAASTAVTFAAGASTATFYYGDTKAGTPTITATQGTLTSATQSETVTAAVTATLTFTQQPGAINSASPFTPALKVQALDAFGNPVVVAISLAILNNPSALGLGRLYQGTTDTNPVIVTSDSTGVATFTAVTIAGALLNLGAAGTGYTLRATVGSVGVTSVPFNVAAIL